MKSKIRRHRGTRRKNGIKGRGKRENGGEIPCLDFFHGCESLFSFIHFRVIESLLSACLLFRTSLPSSPPSILSFLVFLSLLAFFFLFYLSSLFPASLVFVSLGGKISNKMCSSTSTRDIGSFFFFYFLFFFFVFFPSMFG